MRAAASVAPSSSKRSFRPVAVTLRSRGTPCDRLLTTPRLLPVEAVRGLAWRPGMEPLPREQPSPFSRWHASPGRPLLGGSR